MMFALLLIECERRVLGPPHAGPCIPRIVRSACALSIFLLRTLACSICFICVAMNTDQTQHLHTQTRWHTARRTEQVDERCMLVLLPQPHSASDDLDLPRIYPSRATPSAAPTVPFSSGPCATGMAHPLQLVSSDRSSYLRRSTHAALLSPVRVFFPHPTCCVVRCTDAASHSARCWGGELSSKRRTLGLLVMAGLTVLVGEGPSIFFSEFGAGLFGAGLSLPESVVPANTRRARKYPSCRHVQ